jgi:hypothetical protein
MLILVVIICWALIGTVIFVEMLDQKVPLLRWKSIFVFVLAGPFVWLVGLGCLFALALFFSIDKTIEWVKK